MLCKCHWIVLYTVPFTAFCLGGRFFPDTVYTTPLTARRTVYRVGQKSKPHTWLQWFLKIYSSQGSVATHLRCT